MTNDLLSLVSRPWWVLSLYPVILYFVSDCDRYSLVYVTLYFCMFLCVLDRYVHQKFSAILWNINLVLFLIHLDDHTSRQRFNPYRLLVVWKTLKHTSVQAILEIWSTIHLLHLLTKDVNDLAKKWRKKTWMENDFEYRSYYYMNSDEAYPSKGYDLCDLYGLSSLLWKRGCWVHVHCKETYLKEYN
jgi:hypothetical protein